MRDKKDDGALASTHYSLRAPSSCNSVYRNATKREIRGERACLRGQLELEFGAVVRGITADAEPAWTMVLVPAWTMVQGR